MRNTLQHLITDTTLSFNQCIVCDQEITIYQHLHAVMENIPCPNKCCYRLGKYHLLTQWWVDKAVVAITGREAHAILKNMLSILSSFLITHRVNVK